MSDTGGRRTREELQGQAVEIAVRLGLVALLAYWCFLIFKPFLIPFVWGGVLAVALLPICRWIEQRLGGRRKLAAILLVVGCLAAILVPGLLLSESLLEGGRSVSSLVEEGQIQVPPAPERVAGWPLVGPTLYDAWNLASTNLHAVLEKFRPQVKALGGWLVGLAKQGAFALLLTVAALALAGYLLAQRERMAKVVFDIGARIAGDEGIEIVRSAAVTIGTVSKGVVGVAAIQAGLAAVGLVVAGVPGAGLWSLLILILAVAQLPPLLILVPAILYLVATDASMLTIVLFSVWSLVVSLSDGVLKPILLGRGSDTPVWVILVGAIGGLILHGLIGLFVGAVVFSTGQRLFRRWVEAGRGG